MSAKVYYAVFGDNKYLRDAEVYDVPLLSDSLELGKKLCNMRVIYLLSASTGLITTHFLDVGKNGVSVVGVESDAIIKFAHDKKETNGVAKGFIWTEYGSTGLSADLRFDFPFDDLDNDAWGVLPFDDTWNLCITRDLCVVTDKKGVDVIGINNRTRVLLREVRVAGELIVLFRYQLVRRDVEHVFTVFDEEIKLCEALQVYCEILAKLQNRAVFMRVHDCAEEINVMLVKQLQCEWSKLSNEELSDVSCDIGLLVQSNVGYYESEAIPYSPHLSFCFDITPFVAKKLAKRGTPFLLTLLKTRGKKHTKAFKQVFEQYTPNIWNRYI